MANGWKQVTARKANQRSKAAGKAHDNYRPVFVWISLAAISLPIAAVLAPLLPSTGKLTLLATWAAITPTLVMTRRFLVNRENQANSKEELENTTTYETDGFQFESDSHQQSSEAYFGRLISTNKKNWRWNITTWQNSQDPNAAVEIPSNHFLGEAKFLEKVTKLAKTLGVDYLNFWLEDSFGSEVSIVYEKGACSVLVENKPVNLVQGTTTLRPDAVFALDKPELATRGNNSGAAGSGDDGTISPVGGLWGSVINPSRHWTSKYSPSSTAGKPTTPEHMLGDSHPTTHTSSQM